MSATSDPRLIAHQEEWDKVSKELDAENLKPMSYDNTLVPLLGQVREEKILDYGAGPGVLAVGLMRLGADVKVWDINPDMRREAAKKIGGDNVYRALEDIPRGHFDVIICNLVLCIVPEDEVRRIVRNIASMLSGHGQAFIGFCNPLIFDIQESQINTRFPTKHRYEDNHDYPKIKKEGGYRIIESHRPIAWYEKTFQEAGLRIIREHFTPEYEFKGKKICDFIIFQLSSATPGRRRASPEPRRARSGRSTAAY